MRTLFIVALMTVALWGPSPAAAGPYYDSRLWASSATMKLGGILTVENPASTGTPTITLTGAGGVVTATSFVGDLTGNASSATYAATAATTAYSVSTSSDTYWNAKVDRAGDTMTGILGIYRNGTGLTVSYDPAGPTGLTVSTVAFNYIATPQLQSPEITVGAGTKLYDGLFGLGVVSPNYALDVLGGGHFTSSMTVDGGYYGDGSPLTGVIQSSATGTYPLSISGTATTATTATNNVLKAGDTMTGPLTTSSSMTATLGFVGDLIGNADSATTAAAYLPLAGGNMTGQLTTTSSVTVTGNGGGPYGAYISSGLYVGGKIGVGLGASLPSVALEVNPAGINNGIATSAHINMDTNQIRAYAAGGTAAATLFVQFSNNGVTALGSSNVASKTGIGTTSPGAKFDVAGDSQFGTLPNKSTFTATADLYMMGQIVPQQVAASAIAALVPVKLGATITCTDCTPPYTDCKSTAAAAGSWVLAGTTNHCQ